MTAIGQPRRIRTVQPDVIVVPPKPVRTPQPVREPLPVRKPERVPA